MLKKKIVAVLSWLRDNVVAVLLASFVIPGVLAVFNQQSAITRAIFDTDYKAAKLKFQECHRFHAEYISSVRSNQGAALLMHKHFNIDEVLRRGDSPTFFTAYKATLQTYQSSLARMEDSSAKTSQCYGELAATYENLAISLNLYRDFRKIASQGADELAVRTSKRDAVRDEMSARVSLESLFSAMISGDDKSMIAAMRNASFEDLATFQSKNADAEAASFRLERERFNELNTLFSDELNARLHRGLFGYFGSLLRG